MTESASHLEQHPGAGSRAAEAAARVAARYAKAPTYSEMLADEARAAVRAAEAASWAALEAQAAAESLLAGLEAASAAESPRKLEVLEGRASERTLEPVWETAVEPAQPMAGASQAEGLSFGILWDADIPIRQAEPAAVRATHGPGVAESSVEDWWRSARLARNGAETEDIEVVEPAKPIHANLIEFPRELVATRKIRPRLAEGPHGRVGNAMGQLSIFEVDPGSISIEPEAAGPVAEEAAPAWPGPDWSSIQLDEQSIHEQSSHVYSQDELAAEDAEAAPAAPDLELAPLSLRLMAVVVDGALIMGTFLALAMAAMDQMKTLPTIKEIELGSALTLAVLTIAYHLIFFTLAAATPGMKWARISLCTFRGEIANRSQRCYRLGALTLSLAPVGLGVLWAIFDEDRLSWHDRLSGTFMRKG